MPFSHLYSPLGLSCSQALVALKELKVDLLGPPNEENGKLVSDMLAILLFFVFLF